MHLPRLAPAVLLAACTAAMGLSAQESRPAALAETRPETRVVVPEEDWLARHQAPDGRWSAHGFPSRCATSSCVPCEGRGSPDVDVGVTGLALFAHLMAGYDDERPGPYRERVRAGLTYLTSIQDERGRFGPATSPRFAWSHSCATLAMCEAYSATKKARWKRSADAALATMSAEDSPIWPWRTAAIPTNDDVRAAAWAALTLSWAREDEFDVTKDTARVVLRYLDEYVDRAKGEPATRPEPESRPEVEAESRRQGSDSVDCAMAAACIIRGVFELATDEDLSRARSQESLLLARFPTWGEPASNDLQAWYLVTLIAYWDVDAWPSWSKAIRNRVLARQVKPGCAAGSWNPDGAFGQVGGRVYSTSVATLILAKSYRYRIAWK